MALNDLRVRGAKPKDRPYKLGDGNGLWLYVTPGGSRLWRFRFRQPGSGKDTLVSLGDFRDGKGVSLKEARDKRDAMRKQLDAGITPAESKRQQRDAQANTFDAVAAEWLGTQQLADITRTKAEWLFGLVRLDIGTRPIADLKPAEILKALRKIEAKGLYETTLRVKQRISQVFRYAIATERAETDPTYSLRGALKSPEVTNRASLIDPVRVGELMLAIDGYVGQPTTHCALKLAPLTFVRPGELRAAEWSEFQLDGKEPTWRIPGARMKMGTPHVVPLSKQAVAVLREIQPLTGRGRYVFPSLRSAERPMSDNTINAALRRLGYTSEEQTGHGFRSMASTLLNEKGWHPDLIELQLAHIERNKSRRAYNKAQRLPERRKMMDAWAEYLDELRAAAATKAAA